MFGDIESLITLLYGCYAESNSITNSRARVVWVSPKKRHTNLKHLIRSVPRAEIKDWYCYEQ